MILLLKSVVAARIRGWRSEKEEDLRANMVNAMNEVGKLNTKEKN